MSSTTVQTAHPHPQAQACCLPAWPAYHERCSMRRSSCSMRHVHRARHVCLPYTCRPCQGATARTQHPAASLSSATATAPSWMPNARLTTGTYILSAHVQPEAPVPPRRAWQARLVSISEIWSGSSGRPNPHPLSNRGLRRSWPWERRQIAQSCAGDSQRDRSFDGLQANLIRSPSRKRTTLGSIHGCRIPSHLIHTPIISHPIC